MTEVSLLQTLLNADAQIANMSPQDEIAKRTRAQIEVHIEKLRGDIPPHCYGLDDCSTQCLSTCAWRKTCGS